MEMQRTLKHTAGAELSSNAAVSYGPMRQYVAPKKIAICTDTKHLYCCARLFELQSSQLRVTRGS